ncbi:AAA family ATPase [Polaromonas sp.]|uniref:AAA family ATPase n=1 Tax=Polaromonas sp. TaxID=1869339 RepID=UPI0013BC7F57|nr:AAA family ATPase [Polaromonas sp.]NDP63080.1 AAA family ATPase [Polaromonas sp.]
MLIPPEARRPSRRQILAAVPTRFRHPMLRLMPYGALAPSEFEDLQALACWAVDKRRTAGQRADALASMCVLYDHGFIELPRRWQLIEEIAQHNWALDRCLRVAEILFLARLDTVNAHVEEEKIAGMVVGIPTIRGSKAGQPQEGQALSTAMIVLSEAVAHMSARSRGELTSLPEPERLAGIRLLRLYSVLGRHNVNPAELPAARLRVFRSTGKSLWKALTKVALVHLHEPALYGEAAMNRIDHALAGEAERVVRSKSDLPAGRDAAAPPTSESSLMHVVIKGTIVQPTDSADRDFLKPYAILQRPLPLAALPPLETLSSMHFQLRQEFPWAANALEAVFGQLRARKQFGSVRLAFTPLLLCGPPGTGKTRLARRLGEVFELQTMVLKLGGATDAMSILGTSRGWSTGQPSPLLRPLLKGTASALIILDELDKPANGTKNSPPVESALLSLLEPEDARHWPDGYLQTECDLSGMLYIATCNQTTWMPGALKSRFRMVDVRAPTVPELRSVAPFVARDIEAEWGLASGALQGVPFERLLPPRMTSLRQLRRAMQSAIARWLDAPGQRIKH